MLEPGGFLVESEGSGGLGLVEADVQLGGVARQPEWKDPDGSEN